MHGLLERMESTELSMADCLGMVIVFFTGSTGVGKVVAQATAKNLVPCTLEVSFHPPLCAFRYICNEELSSGFVSNEIARWEIARHLDQEYQLQDRRQEDPVDESVWSGTDVQ